MNRKINKITTWLAAAIFLLALAINVKVTLDDPFMMLSDEAIAQTTNTTASGDPSEGGLLPLFDEISRECSILIGGGGGTTVEFSITKTAIFSVLVGGYYYRPTDVKTGHKLICSWAWAVCTPGDCIVDED